MLVSLDELQALCEHIVKRERAKVAPDRAVIASAHHEAEQLSSQCPEDEPAALFLALARRSRDLGPVAKVLVPAAAHDAALASGRDLMRGDTELTLDRLRILRGAMSWDELRASFAECLRPIGAAEKTPPRRPP